MGALREHALNRSFRTEGREWEEFVDSIKRRGVEVPLLVRELVDEPGVYEVLAGHRRRRGALEAGVKRVGCVVRVMTDGEALELVVLENLQREEMTPVDEAEGVRALLGLGMAEKEVARRISRSLEWVRTRQGLLDLPGEVLDGLRRRRDERGHVDMGTVEVLLSVPAEWREEAVQLVMHPVLETEPLRARQAREVVEQCVMVPRGLERAWDGELEEAVRVWKRRLKQEVIRCLRKEGMGVLGVPWGERGQWERGMVGALVAVPAADLNAGAPEGVRWLDVAVRHGVAVRVCPVEKHGEVEAVAMVPETLLRQAEEAWREGSAGAWLAGRKKVPSGKCEVRSEEEDEGEKRVEKALAGLEGEGGEVPEERPELVITQGVEHWVWMDYAQVKRVAMWALNEKKDEVPEWVPDWARWMAAEEDWLGIDSVVNWVEGLKR